MLLLYNFVNVVKGIFRIEQLRSKVFYTLGVIAVYRLGVMIPLPGIDLNALGVLKDSFSSAGFLGYLNTISGGALSACSIFTLGISPYITASIMMQFLSLSFPYLEALSKEGESGRAIISRYTRFLAVFVACAQAAGVALTIENGFGRGISLVLNPGWFFKVKILLMLSAGAIFVMWLGEQISRFGIGQGSSMIMFAGIVSSLPTSLARLYYGYDTGELPVFALLTIIGFVAALIAGIIFLEKGERRIPVYYAKRIVGRGVSSVSNVPSYIPFKINSAGVMPVILTGPLLGMIVSAYNYVMNNFFPGSSLVGLFTDGGWPHIVLMALLIVWFHFAYMAVTFNPFDLAENLRKGGGFIPGLRPGHKTAEFFDYVLNRIGTPGSLYIAMLAILPSILFKYLGYPFSFSGLSLLIAIGVALDTSSQVESYLLENKYEKFLIEK